MRPAGSRWWARWWRSRIGRRRPPLDLWAALTARRQRWLAGHPRLVRVVRTGALVWTAVMLVGFLAAWATVPAWRDAVRPWLWAYVGLALVVLVARTRTVPWKVVGLCFSAGCLLAVPIGWLEVRAADLVGAEVEFQDGAVLVAGPVEEALKLLPLAAVLLLARRRVRGFAVVDFLLIGYAAGLGFQVVEDGMRPLVDSTRETTSLAEIFLGLEGGGPEATYGVTWLPGAWMLDFDQQAWFAGHAVLSGLVAVGVGLAYRLRHRLGPLVLLVPVALFAMVVVDHAMMNDVASRPFGDLGLDERMPEIDRDRLPEGVEVPPLAWEHEVEVPGWVVRSWELWGRGRFAAPLLTGLLGVALLLDARRAARALPSLPALPTPPGIARLRASSVQAGGPVGAAGLLAATVTHEALLTGWSLGREPPVTWTFDPATGEWRGSDGSVARADPTTGHWTTAGAGLGAGAGSAVGSGSAVVDAGRRRRARRLRRWLVATSYLRARRRRAHHLEDRADRDRHPSTVWRWAAWCAAVGGLVLGLVALLNLVYGDRITASAVLDVGDPALAFLADLLRGLAEWWDGLSFAEKALVVLALTGLLTFGVGYGFGLGWGFWATFAVVDAATLVPEHGRGLADLIEDPEAAWSGYWDDFTWQRGAWDAWEVASVVPGHSATGNLADSWRSHIDEMAEGGARQADDSAAQHADDAADSLTDDAARQADEVVDAATPSRTTPSHDPDPTRRPTGNPEPLPARADEETLRAFNRQNEAADELAQAGYDVHHRPRIEGSSRRPDYLVEGKVFDCKAPRTDNPRAIWSSTRRSIRQDQAHRFILNLRNSDVSIDALRAQFHDWPLEGLEEVLVLRNGEVLPLFP